MPEKIEKDGKEIEVFTAQEVQDQKDAALDEFKKANPDKSEEITKLQTDLKNKEDELKGLKEKDFNFGTLRKEKAELETKINALTGEVDSKITKAKNEILEGVLRDSYTENLNKLSGGDKDLQAKIELQYKRLGDSAATKEEIAKKLTDAFVLATGGATKPLDGFSSSGAGRPNFGNQSGGTKLTNEEKAMAQELAARGGMTLTDKDLEKY